MTGFRIVPVEARHRADWDRLYAGYAEFYGVTQTPEMRDRVWSWLHDPAHESCGLVAEDEAGRAVGLAHFRPFARPLSASTGGYLDDLFVDPQMRGPQMDGRRVADALIEAIAEEGRRRGWSVIRWITAESNARARAVYDRVAKLTPWRTYDIPL
ncbi:GNAT family N-acetyltransferase [Muricoccus aerilatus]|uniref:GNAT family N-acetyltransferase n=1 Tax=Muricoccus aerilatus TaxID=452982 RepID=UPI0005C20F8F|nr:GNAT family N-acetyltransferase [Roseomonas aerilata]